MRHSIVLQLHCSKCGSVLELVDRKSPAELTGDEELPTGAAMLPFVMTVDPCRVCVGKLVNSARQVSAGLTALQAGLGTHRTS